MTGDQAPSYAMVTEFQKRRDFLFEAVNQIPGFSSTQPDGAFYLFPSVKETGLSGYEMSQKLLEKASVATVPGEYFGGCGAGHIRISYVNSLENIEEAVANIKDTMSKG